MEIKKPVILPLVISLLTFCFLFGVSLVFASGDKITITGKVEGIVYNDKGQKLNQKEPFQNARVFLAKTQGDGVISIVGDTFTDEDGTYTINCPSKPGEVYTLTTELVGPEVRVCLPKNESEAKKFIFNPPTLTNENISGDSDTTYDFFWDKSTPYKGEAANVFYYMTKMNKYVRETLKLSFDISSAAFLGTPIKFSIYGTAGGKHVFFLEDGSGFHSSVIYHEYTHMVTRLCYKNKFGADFADTDETNIIQEALADYFACTINNNSTFEVSSGAPRELNNKESYIEKWVACDNKCLPIPHPVSVVLSGAFWELRGLVTSAIADLLIHKARLDYGPKTMEDYLAAIIRVDIDNNGGENRNLILKAFLDHDIYLPNDIYISEPGGNAKITGKCDIKGKIKMNFDSKFEECSLYYWNSDQEVKTQKNGTKINTITSLDDGGNFTASWDVSKVKNNMYALGALVKFRDNKTKLPCKQWRYVYNIIVNSDDGLKIMETKPKNEEENVIISTNRVQIRFNKPIKKNLSDPYVVLVERSVATKMVKRCILSTTSINKEMLFVEWGISLSPNCLYELYFPASIVRGTLGGCISYNEDEDKNKFYASDSFYYIRFYTGSKDLKNDANSISSASPGLTIIASLTSAGEQTPAPPQSAYRVYNLDPDLSSSGRFIALDSEYPLISNIADNRGKNIYLQDLSHFP